MKFGLIDPKCKTVTVLCADTIDAALSLAGLSCDDVIFTRVGPGLAVASHKQSLMFSPGEQSYFALIASPEHERQLYGGKSVLVAYDDEPGNNTDDADVQPLHITWMSSAAAVEAAIDEEFIKRPTIVFNGVVTWEWNASPPVSKMH